MATIIDGERTALYEPFKMPPGDKRLMPKLKKQTTARVAKLVKGRELKAARVPEVLD